MLLLEPVRTLLHASGRRFVASAEVEDFDEVRMRENLHLGQQDVDVGQHVPPREGGRAAQF